MKYFRLLGLLATLWACATNAQTFNDVPSDYWSYSSIEILTANGVTGGCGNGNYCPEDLVTRAQMAVFLERGMKGSDYLPPAASGNVFLDIAAGDFAASFIEQLYADGVTGGCGNGSFCPNGQVTRAQMAVFLLRAKYGAAYQPPPPSGVFSDVPVGSFAAAFIEQLAAEGITGGCGNGNYCPDAAVTRAQMAVFLVRTFGLAMPPTIRHIIKLVDSDTILPGGGTLSCQGVPPITVKDGKILFLSSEFFGPLFVIEDDGIRRIAGTGDTLPGATPGIPGFGGFDIDGPNIFFSALQGIYKDDSGSLSLIADMNSATPAGDETFGGFHDVVADNGLVSFMAGSNSAGTAFGIYQYNGNEIAVIVNSDTPDPGRAGSVPNQFSDLSGVGGFTAFGASDFASGYEGLYVFDGNALTAIANTDSSLPGGRDRFDSAKNTLDENGRILFNGTDGAGNYPFYQWSLGILSLAIDVPMITSDTNTELYTWKGYWASDTTRVVTHNLTDDGQGNSAVGLYLHQNGRITKIIDTNEFLDGKEAYDLFPLGINGNSLVFLPWFIDDSCGLYSVDLTPSSIE